MKKELQIFLGAISFFTRLPVRLNSNFNQHYFYQSAKYLPLIGWLIGLLQGLIFYVFQLVLPINIALLFSLLFGIVITGALHEDGFIDSCDAISGKNTHESLQIMKDSRIGSYGAIGVCFLFLLKFEALKFIAGNGYYLLWLALVGAQTISRLLIFLIILSNRYVGGQQSKSKAMVTNNFTLSEITIALMVGLLPLVGFGYKFLLLVIPLWVGLKIWLSRFFNSWVGGYTGDLLGAAQQVGEVVFYLWLIAIFSLF